MIDYKEMYLKLFRALTVSIDILKDAQRECEEIYISNQDDEILETPQTQELS